MVIKSITDFEKVCVKDILDWCNSLPLPEGKEKLQESDLKINSVRKSEEGISGSYLISVFEKEISIEYNYVFSINTLFRKIMKELSFSEVEIDVENKHQRFGTYRKKPIEIEAFQYDGDLMDRNRFYYIPNWAIEAYEARIMYYDSGELYIKTLEGNHHVSVGDYVIKGVKGELYPCKPDIFEQTYEFVK